MSNNTTANTLSLLKELTELNTFSLLNELTELMPVPHDIDSETWEQICSQHYASNPFRCCSSSSLERYEAMDRMLSELGFDITQAGLNETDSTNVSEVYAFTMYLIKDYLYFYLPHKMNGTPIEPVKPIKRDGNKYPEWV